MTYQEMKVLASHAGAVSKIADAARLPGATAEKLDQLAEAALETFLKLHPDSPLKALLPNG